MPISYRAAQTLIKRNDEPAFAAALASGLDPQANNQNGWTLLMLAAVEGNADIGKLLLEKGAKTTAVNNKGQTALAIATQKGHIAFAELLQSCPS